MPAQCAGHRHEPVAHESRERTARWLAQARRHRAAPHPGGQRRRRAGPGDIVIDEAVREVADACASRRPESPEWRHVGTELERDVSTRCRRARAARRGAACRGTRAAEPARPAVAGGRACGRPRATKPPMLWPTIARLVRLPATRRRAVEQGREHAAVGRDVQARVVVEVERGAQRASERRAVVVPEAPPLQVVQAQPVDEHEQLPRTRGRAAPRRRPGRGAVDAPARRTASGWRADCRSRRGGRPRRRSAPRPAPLPAASARRRAPIAGAIAATRERRVEPVADQSTSCRGSSGTRGR